ncbi:hypothetical protein RJ639_028878 [Escallonia herrerae]|uniref:Uncharacterized protein n=1 Tax=Escallonia herrerae TaxID=1293975 RepID=A0AA88X3A9_9ASTE|nr:hypothetical protein RJ639_028878 [Escallonia herrerae]
MSRANGTVTAICPTIRWRRSTWITSFRPGLDAVWFDLAFSSLMSSARTTIAMLNSERVDREEQFERAYENGEEQSREGRIFREVGYFFA